jgi:hypothetical protein
MRVDDRAYSRREQLLPKPHKTLRMRFPTPAILFSLLLDPRAVCMVYGQSGTIGPEAVGDCPVKGLSALLSNL